uniref:Photosystem I P700 chlorophyll a apoprotein n=1 Tax=Solanum tuberosum TaxID=4113 RepID=M1AVL3_SOLTU
MYNSISVVIFHFSWKMQSDVWGSVSDQGVVTHITGGNFAQSSITINGWLRDFLWAQASQVIQSYGSSLSAYGLKTNKGSEKKDRCRDSMEAILTNGVKCVGRGLFTSKL